MGIFNSIKEKLFKKEQPTEVSTPELQQEIMADGNPKYVNGVRFCNHKCECGCDKVIGEERYSKVQGHYFFKSHLAQKKRAAFNGN